MPAPEDIAANLNGVNSALADSTRAAGREAGSVRLIAVSKTHPAEKIESAIAAGQRLFGENRVQEALGKWPAIKERHGDTKRDMELHLIGPLQSNKAPQAVRLFDAIETVDRPKLAAALARQMEKSGRRPTCFIQVNTGEEKQKAGIAPGDADRFIRACREEYLLPVQGLMCIPPADEEAALHFALLGGIAKRNGLDALSMGMSQDYEIAVRFGATHVRVGTAIFGPRRTAVIPVDKV